MKFFVRDLFCRPRIYLERTGNWRELPQYTLSLVWNWILGKCLPNTSTIRNIQATEFSNNKPSLSFTCQQNPAGTLAAQLISLLSVTSRNVQDLVIPLKMFAVISILLKFLVSLLSHIFLLSPFLISRVPLVLACVKWQAMFRQAAALSWLSSLKSFYQSLCGITVWLPRLRIWNWALRKGNHSLRGTREQYSWDANQHPEGSLSPKCMHLPHSQWTAWSNRPQGRSSVDETDSSQLCKYGCSCRIDYIIF